MSGTRVAEHRPAVKKRRFRHDELVAVDLFSGFGGLTTGMELAGFTTIMAANHNRYKVDVHEANHPDAEHWIADLVDKEASDYHSARDLPPADMIGAGVSCVNHSPANTKKAYAQGLSLFDMDDPDYEEAVTKSERDRATANCVLHYAAVHHPRLILIECTTELSSWGPLVPGKKKVGDGSTYRWWLKQFELLGYKYRVLYLNSQFFGVGQSRDRLYIAMWKAHIPTPNLDHRPHSWCGRCDRVVEAVWTWKTGVPLTGTVRYGQQYNYRCPSCRGEVVPPMTPSLAALDLRDLGTRIGDRKKPLAAATMARAERCRQRFAEFPAVLMPAKSQRGSERHPWQPMATQTSQQETALLSTGAVMVAAGNTFERPGSNCRSRDLSQPLWTQTATNTTGLVTPPVAIAVNNFQGAPRGIDEPLPTQGGSETLSVVSAGVVPFRKNTVPTVHSEPMPTVTAEQIPGLLTAAGLIKNNGSIEEAGYRSHPLSNPLGAVTGQPTQALLFSGWFKQHGSQPHQFPAPHPLSDPLGAITGHDTTSLLTSEWHSMLADITLEDCYFRMLGPHEIGRGCGFDVDFADHKGTFIVWGSNRDQVDGYGNAVSPAVGEWISARLRDALHREVAA
ncbi:DNA cytosine methyltransferase [Mycobacterium sp. CBMA293]|uniref:DNA cytosine methyltransferase n=1 Tax=unclassified Mycolicibacterium TaxID=2636767 RepID=UPI0012DD2951|nr:MULTISPECIES: DNA cytosine methyltransferase [unclassified Mycolicibacterium]MUL47584.1 DNA cytosine methyltransferase [Mycolicibacterium sp. CBMA 360]MUL61898.1 DNA cytosine methyltransferase [Mycolicibacterium sp. CBMA 335]MUL68971.1 DNA cytosine methyltransferase [Mycolicibacterium sp. CBMA 311]MUL92812.1 DNA cytosine methyltransferase [Mycolicibacterium sp. CBMA 230]MUM08746.1 DNA cytosine methyltransferase [Mycolicibacterium sp. CBMA 213]